MPRPAPMLALTLTVAALFAPSWGTAQEPPAPAEGAAPAAPASDRWAKVPTLVIQQEANGLPNQPSEDTVPQRLMVTPDRLRLDDLQSGVTYLLGLDSDPPTFYEVSYDGKTYRVGDDLDQLQRTRDRSERQVLELLAKEPKVKRDAVMTEAHLRPDLEREVTIERPEGTRELLGRETSRIIVRENGRVIVDAWLAREDFGIPFFEFYRRVGAFSNEVLEELRTLEGIPLQVDFTVVTATFTYPISVTARSLTFEDVPIGELMLPTGAKKIEESPFAHCPVCGQQVEKAAPPAGRSRRRDGSDVFFDRRECKVEFNRREFPERFGGTKKPAGREPR